MNDGPSHERFKAVERAIRLIAEALDLLDAAGTPPQVTAPLELALAALRGELDQSQSH